jgi:hypothetical protein
MTDDELHAAILADPEAKALADAGNDAGCAARLAAILPPTIGRRMVDASNILEAFPNPVEGLTVLGTIRAVAAGDSPLAPAIKEVLPWLDTPGSPGLNVGSPSLRAMLDILAGIGALTVDQVAAIKALAPTSPAVVTDGQVSAAWYRHRPGGLVPSPPSPEE